VTQKKTKPVQVTLKTDPSALYKPLGLKAVLAAHTALKGKPRPAKTA
jgi:hypothetical protein